ncbi:hypothetical protein AMTRI_Chr02g259750 [Amborella trichopoda]
MTATSKIKSVDFYRKIPRDLTEASLSGAGLSIIAAFSMILLFGMELNSYLAVSTTTTVIVDRSMDGEFLRMEFNLSFPALSCEFASVDVSDVLGTNRLNITKTLQKFSIDPNLRPTGAEFHPGPIPKVNHGDEVDEEYGEGSVVLRGDNFDAYSHQHEILFVNFYAPWCYWSNRLKPSWEKAAKIIKERYDLEEDGRILVGKVDCTKDIELCKSHHIQGYPSIRIFRKGSDVRLLITLVSIIKTVVSNSGTIMGTMTMNHIMETETQTMESLVAPIPLESHKLALEDKSNRTSDSVKRPAPLTGGCRIEGFVRVKKVPGNLVISAHSGAHSFDASMMNMSHYISHLSFGKRLSLSMISEVNRLSPYVGGSVDRLTGKSYMTNQGDANANVTVLVTENPRSFSHFITNVCAIIGGVFTVAGILDSILQNTIRLVKKVELGKQF